MDDHDEPRGSGKSDYEVGYGKPPRATRWPKGKSGNPRGRAKGSKSLATDLAVELARKVRVTQGGRTVALSMQQATLRAMMTKAIKGDMRAAQLAVQLAERLFPRAGDAQAKPSLSAEDAEVLDAFLSRMNIKPGGGEDGAA